MHRPPVGVLCAKSPSFSLRAGAHFRHRPGDVLVPHRAWKRCLSFRSLDQKGSHPGTHHPAITLMDGSFNLFWLVCALAAHNGKGAVACCSRQIMHVYDWLTSGNGRGTLEVTLKNPGSG